MIAYLPTIYPDELVYSWFCRYYVHEGCITHKMALQELYCNRSDNPSKEFIGNLKMKARNEIAKTYSMDMLILNHTMFPQYARFIGLEKKKSALNHLRYDSCDVHHLFCVLPRTGDEQYLRYCPLCVMEDRQKYGETYWHRKHQIRNIGICTKHVCKLVASDVAAKSEHDYVFYPAESVIKDCSSVVHEENQQLIKFSAYVESVFDMPMNFANDIPVSAILYDVMGRTKYLKTSGKTRNTQMLAKEMIRFYDQMGISNIASLYQIQRAIRGEHFDFSVICQIAFYLGISAYELTSPMLTQEQIQKENSSHYVNAAVPVNWEVLDAETAPKLEMVAQGIYDGSANASGRPERVSERQVYRELGLKGHQLEHMPRCRAILERYAESYPESWARKIVWAYQKLQEHKETFYWSDLRKLSGVKKKNYSEVKTYLFKHADVDLVNRIVLLVGEV